METKLKLMIPAAAALTALGLNPATAQAQPAGGHTDRYPIVSEPFTEPAGSVCPFELDVTFPYQKEIETDYYDSSGTLVSSVVTGPLFADFTNASTGTSVERNLSGRGEFAYQPDGSFTATFDGHAGVGFHPGDHPSDAYLVFSGQAVIQFASSGSRTIERLDGSAEDLCLTLA